MNLITLSGFVKTEKINIRELPDGTPVTSFILKVPSDVDKNKYELISITCWQKMTEFVEKNLEQGTAVIVKGSLHVDNRTLKGYDVFKNGEKISDFKMPYCEINAMHIEKI